MKSEACLAPTKAAIKKQEKGSNHFIARTHRLQQDRVKQLRERYRQLERTKEAAKKSPEVAKETVVAMYDLIDGLLISFTELYSVVEELVDKIESAPSTSRLKLSSSDSLLQLVLKDGNWFEAKEVSDHAGYRNVNKSSMPNRWKNDRRIFAIRHNGKDLFPGYALGDDGKPIESMHRVLEIFGRQKTPLAVAAWFANDNSWLSGAKPMDVIRRDPEKVIKAAKMEVEPIVHG
ncbi:hypothetical protein [Shewanella sedimentimangrovi]|uniref:Antitoxin Xre/MbcA/ParS-like toxin-binding domain-containing protein n=1 Tax=Shewanella sedimentimangrovi TaxID=2814293 RepID=A0ABX7QX16_9GAMM|nr:hypothetical protein [Shewanella sedimentimangrovi]QSX35587.1 hypothetical protein JYB85_09270 [Shewanella sedimentimangrovi]